MQPLIVLHFRLLVLALERRSRAGEAGGDTIHNA